MDNNTNNIITEAESKDYKAGYAAAIEEIKRALSGGGNTPGGDPGPKQGRDPRLKNPPVKSSQQQPQGGNSGSGNNGDSKDKGNQDKKNAPNKDPFDLGGQGAANEAKKQAKEAKDAAKKAQKSADNAKAKADKSGSKEDQDAANKAQDAANKAKDAANKAQQAADKADQAAQNGDDQEARNQAKEAKNQADEAKNQADKAQNGDSKGQPGNNSGNNGQNSQNHDKSEEDGEADQDSWSGGEMDDKDKDPEKMDDSDTDIWDCRDIVNPLQDEFRGKITGVMGDFLSKTKAGIDEIAEIARKKKGGASKVKTYAQRAKPSWDIALNQIINEYVEDMIDDKEAEMEETYMRPNRRQGEIHYGEDFLKPGEQVKEDKLDITMTYYIDKSGSMSGGKLENAFKAAKLFADCVMKNNEDESVVGDFEYKYYAFDESFHECKPNQIPRASSGNVDFNEILEYIHKHSLNDMINVIITDAQFPINPRKCIEAISKTQGLFIVVANNASNQSDFEEIEKALDGKFHFLLADEDFTFNPSKIH